MIQSVPFLGLFVHVGLKVKSYLDALLIVMVQKLSPILISYSINRKLIDNIFDY